MNRSPLSHLALIATALIATANADDWSDEKIAVADANATEILISYGLSEQIVAVDGSSQIFFPDKDLPDLGYHRALSAEGVLSTEPTIFVGSDVMGPPETLASLRSAEVDVRQLPSPADIDGLLENIKTVGDWVGRSAQSEQIIAGIEEKSQALKEASGSEQPTMIFLLDFHSRGLSKAGTGTTGDALIRILGGQNLAEYSGYKAISIEAILELNPDVILVGSRDIETDAGAELVEKNPLLAVAEAVANGRILSVNSGVLTAGVSMGVIDEATRLSRLVY